MAANTLHTVAVFPPVEGIGPGVTTLGITVASDQPVLVEKPTYSANLVTYGTTDTAGYSTLAF